MSRQDRQRGALLGLAVGDALGAAVEFQMPGTFAPVTGYRGGGPHGLGPGEWTDDTSMALAWADSIGDAGWDIDDQARRSIVNPSREAKRIARSILTGSSRNRTSGSPIARTTLFLISLSPPT